MTSLLDPKTLHHLDALIFCVAVFHVVYSMSVLFISQVRLGSVFCGVKHALAVSVDVYRLVGLFETNIDCIDRV